MTAKDKVQQNLKGKEAYTLNLTDGLNDRIVSNAEQIIAQLQASKERMFPAYEEKRIYFEEVQREWLEVKQQWDNLDEEIKHQQVLIQTMRTFRKSEGSVKRLQVIREPEHREGTPAPKRISWLSEATRVLEREQRFLSADALAELVLDEPTLQETAKQLRNNSRPYLKSTAINMFSTHAEQTAAGKHRHSRLFKPVLTQYKNLIGLYDWVDEENVPKPQFIKEFMFA